MEGKAGHRRRSPIVEARWLAAELTRLRQASGWSTQGEVAKALKWPAPKLSMIENRKRPVQEEDLERLLDLYEVPRSSWVDYLTAAGIARRYEWWDHDLERSIEEQLRVYTGYEQGASQLRTYQSGVPHGLLQTPEYTAALLRQRTPEPISGQLVSDLVAHRSKRQRVLAQDTDPFELHMVLDESALHRVVGSRATMHAQLDHLVQVATTNRRVTVQIVPNDRPGAFAANYGPFTIIDFPPDRGTGVVFIEHMRAATFNHALEDIYFYSALFEQLCELALPSSESLQKISTLKEEVYAT